MQFLENHFLWFLGFHILLDIVAVMLAVNTWKRVGNQLNWKKERFDFDFDLSTKFNEMWKHARPLVFIGVGSGISFVLFLVGFISYLVHTA
jgi:hypothetical protein